MKILVTGSTGFMGYWIAKELVQREHEVFGFDDMSGGTNMAPHRFQKIDIRNVAEVRDAVSKIKPDILVHLAANAREGASAFQPYEVTTRNSTGYAAVLESCLQYGLKKVVMFSSMAVYGEQPTPFDETLLRKPVDVYGGNKALMEETTELLSEVYGYKYLIFRPHNVFGEFQSLKDKYRNVIGIFMNRLMRKEPLYIYGDGEQKRAFSYVLNSLPCYIRAIEDDSLKNQIINIGGMKEYTVNEIARLVMKYMGMEAELVYLAERPGEVKNAWCTYAKSVEQLGYNETYSVEEGIRRMAGWALKQGPQDWTTEELTLMNDKVPLTWRPGFKGVAPEPLARS